MVVTWFWIKWEQVVPFWNMSIASLRSSYLNFSFNKCPFNYLKSITSHFFPELVMTTDRWLHNWSTLLTSRTQQLFTRSIKALVTISFLSSADLWFSFSIGSGKESSGNLYLCFIQLITGEGACNSCSQKPTLVLCLFWIFATCWPISS